MSSAPNRYRTGRAGELWPVFLLLLVIAVPTTGVLWFLRLAMENQRLATQQQLTNSYKVHLETIREQINTDLEQRLIDADGLMGGDVTKVHDTFIRAVGGRIADAVILLDPAGGVKYPRSFSVESFSEVGTQWDAAHRLENELADAAAAYRIYSQIAEDATSELERMAAIQAQLRCLLQAGDKNAAMDLVSRLLQGGVFDELHRRGSRSMAANIQLMAVEQLDHTAHVRRILEMLLESVNTYSQPLLSSPQRLFLMKQLERIVPGRVNQDLLQAEDLAARFLAVHPTPSQEPILRETQLSGIWQASTPSGRIILLLRRESLRKKAVESMAAAALPLDASIAVLAPGEEAGTSALLSIPASLRLPGWRLTLSLRDAHQIDALTTALNRLYLWTGLLVVMFTCGLSVVIVRLFRRQIRLANLKNDLVGTVSHELKTPLSSMRLLVDTLLEEDQLDDQTTRDYLQLIAKENVRLSRLIDNFLTFTRMDQNRHVYDFCRLTPVEIVDAAVESAGDRFSNDDCSLTVHVQPGLPMLQGDKDRLVSVLLNLLDNAYKYSEPDRRIALSASARDGYVCFSVSDNGIGLSRTDKRRVFQRFFQVDQSLARDGAGCGLGLGIVDAIVKAHRGRVKVSSSPGEGSTFTIELPSASQVTEVEH